MRHVLILAFTMEDAYRHRPFIETLLNEIKKNERDYSLLLLFSYGDMQIESSRYIPRGTEAFVKTLEPQDAYAALCINFAPRKNAVIIPGGETAVSPRWLIERLANACKQSDILYTFQGGTFGSLFRLGFLASDIRASFFLNSDIPCAVFLLPDTFNEDSYKTFFNNFLSDYSVRGTEIWDKHYIYLHTKNGLLLFGERFVILCCIIVSFISLFILCEFSFIHKEHRKTRKAVLRLWYILPVTVLLSAVSFQISQPIAALASKLFHMEMQLQFIMKTMTAFIIVTALYLFQVQRQSIIEKRAYGYILALVSVLNIFIFSAVDISLFFLFTVEYIIIYLFQPAKRVGTLTLSFLIMAIPFLPYAIQIIKYGTFATYNAIAHSSFKQNLLLAFIFLPFLLQWLRIIARINERWRKLALTQKGIRIRNAVISTAATVIVILLLVIAVRYIPTLFISSEHRQPPPTPSMQQRDDDLITCTVSDRSFFDDMLRTLTIQLGAEAEQCTVTLTGAYANAVIYSDAQYISDTTRKTDTFIMPPWPPETLTFSYTADASVSSTVTITAIYPGSEIGERITRTHVVEIPALAKTAEGAL
ncbi:MAG: hypothetical protein J6I73_03655 [Treponema sp.]|nr:hypothetical protein [Treponema sp.]